MCWVNRSFVKQYLDDVPLDRALGQSLGMNATRESKVQAPTQIVGIVDDVEQDGADGPLQPEMFVSVAQLPGLNFEGWYLVAVDEPGPFVYGRSPSDWFSFAAGPALLLVTGTLACVAPARRVAQTDPSQILRQ